MQLIAMKMTNERVWLQGKTGTIYGNQQQQQCTVNANLNCIYVRIER